MQGFVGLLENRGAYHTLASGMAAFFGAIIVIFMTGLLASRLGAPLGAAFHGARKFYRRVVAAATYITGTRYTQVLRWIFFALWFGLCVAIVAFGPPAAVFAALTAGSVAVFCIVRHFRWDEDEQARGIVGNAKRIDVKLDLRLETVCAIALLFGLAAMGFSRLDRAYDFFAAGNASWRAPLHIAYAIFAVIAFFQFVRIARRFAQNAEIGEIERALQSGDDKRQNRAMTQLIWLGLRRQDKAVSYLANMLGRPQFAPKLRLRAADGLSDIAQRWGAAGHLYEAVNGYAQLLDEWNPQAAPGEWAMNHNHEDVAAPRLDERMGGAKGIERLKAAAAAYRAAFRVGAEKNGRAATQYDLGIALASLGEKLGGAEGAEKLKAAVAAYEASLRLCTERETPAEWAAAQYRLGMALSSLGERLGGAEGAEKLKAAIAAYEASLRVFSRQRNGDSALAAKTKNNLDAAMRALEEWRDDGA